MQIGPIFLPERLTGANYLQFLREELPGIIFPPDELDDMPLIRRRIIYVYDGCPAHYAGKIKYFNVTQRCSLIRNELQMLITSFP